MSENIVMEKSKFKKFINNMQRIDLKRMPKDKSTFPLCFAIFYKNKYILNFEYRSEFLEFYVIGLRENDKNRYFKTTKEMEGYDDILAEIETKIKRGIK